MRMIKGLTFGIMFFGIVAFLLSQKSINKPPDCKEVNCGKVVGTILDAETGENVKEEFCIAFCDCEKTNPESILWGDSDFFKYIFKVENNGKFSINIPEGKYCLCFYPKLFRDSKYASDTFPGFSSENTQEIIVSRAKVTTIRKFVKPCGTLKITLTDAEGNKINPMEIFTQRIRLKAKLFSDSIFLIPARAALSDENELNDGEMIIHSLPPGAYNLNVEFDEMGYGNQEFENIIIERKKMTQLNVMVDLNSTTGIEGTITDRFNTPLKNFKITATCIDCKEQIFYENSGKIHTDINGKYKIIGLKEKPYKFDIYGEINGVSIERTMENIPIRNNIILKKDIVIDVSQ